MINIFVREKGYITVKGYDRAAHLVARIEESTSRYIDFEVDESFYGGLTGTKYERALKVHVRINDIITVEDVNAT